MTKAKASCFGFHAGIAGGLHRALLKANEYGCNAVQIFSRNPRGWAARELTVEAINEFYEVRETLGIERVVVHANYLINLAASNQATLEKSRTAFRDEITRANTLKADYLVVHPGSSTGAGEVFGIETCANSLRAACDELDLSFTKILIENTAGQGDVIGHRFEHLRDIIAACPKLELGVCFDTAHAFASGYELRDASALDETLEALDACINLANVPVIHFNDSKTTFNSRVDRHANIGAGEIGADALRRVVRHKSFNHAAFVLETPHEPLEALARDVELLREFSEPAVKR